MPTCSCVDTHNYTKSSSYRDIRSWLSTVALHWTHTHTCTVQTQLQVTFTLCQYCEYSKVWEVNISWVTIWKVTYYFITSGRSSLAVYLCMYTRTCTWCTSAHMHNYNNKNQKILHLNFANLVKLQNFWTLIPRKIFPYLVTHCTLLINLALSDLSNIITPEACQPPIQWWCGKQLRSIRARLQHY